MPSIRGNLTDALRRAQTTNGKGTLREMDDKHLVQEGTIDTLHSFTAQNVEYMQPAGHTAVVLKQFEDKGQKKRDTKKSNGSSGKKGEPNQAGEWNHDQPRGKSAEAVVSYIHSQASHPIITVIDDRRVRPYAMKPGESAHYATSGTGQMLFHNDDGSYLVAVNNKSEEEDAEEKERFASLRHVNKQKQKREIKKGEEVQEHKHQGESVNTEVRCTSGRIEFRVGDSVVGYYDKGSQTWYFKGKIAQLDMSEKTEIVGETRLGLDALGDGGSKVVTLDGPAKKTYAKV